MQKFSDINKARAANKGKVIIWYPFNLGGMLADRWMWMAEKDGSVLDYDSKAALLAQYKDAVLLTLHRDGSVSA
jgi:hypothetical protein